MLFSWTNIQSWFWILFMFAVSVSSSNEPDLYYTCDESGLLFKLTFDQPFKGLVYIKGHSSDPSCRLSLPVDTVNASFDVNLMACDVLNPPTLDANLSLKGFLVFQRHPMVPTVNDSIQPFLCVVQKKPGMVWSEIFWKASLSVSDSPKVHSWLDFELLPRLTQKTSKPSSSYIYVYIEGATKFMDMVVTDCIAHRESILLQNNSIYQLKDPNRCSQKLVGGLSPFKVLKNSTGLMVGAYSEIDVDHILSLKDYFMSCSAILCEYKCECSDLTGYEVVVTGKFPTVRSKRSTLDPFPNKQKDSRKRLMRSSVKVLADRLMKYRKQAMLLQNSTDLVRRTSTSDRKVNFEDETVSPDLLDQHFSTYLITEIPLIVDDQKWKSSGVKISTTITPEKEVERTLTKLVEHTTTMKIAQETLGFIPGGHTMAIVHDFETDTTVKFGNQPVGQTTSIPTPAKDEDHEGFNSTLNETSEIEKQMAENGTIYEAHPEIQHYVSKLRFIIVTTVLSFVVFCLTLISCGLFLYLKKEKRNRSIDNFLLYNFY